MATKQNKRALSETRDEADEEVKKSGAARPDEMPADVLEFITAIDEYKRQNRRPFPSWSEVLEILKGLGYSRAG